MAIRLLVAEDFDLLREDLCETLRAQKDMQVVGQASSGAQILKLALETDFDVILMDIEMETTTAGIRATEEILRAKPDAVIVATHMMLAAHNEGVGCCWVMHFDPAAIREAFGIPAGVEPAALLVLGWPAENAKPLPLHFQTRPLEETVVYDHF